MDNLYTPEEVSAMIRSGAPLVLAGDLGVLSQLPKGNWIGGTTPFFILYPDRRITSYDKIFVHSLPDFVKKVTVQEYDADTIQNIYSDAPKNGLTVLLIPFGCETCNCFALNATSYEGFAVSPLVGWVTGRPLDSIMTEPSFATSGISGEVHSDRALAMHIELPEDKYAELHIFNPYKQGKGDDIRFDRTGMVLKDAYINGVKRNFAAYLRETGFDESLPFVANYAGAMINVVCCGIGEEEVYVSAPVFPSTDYRVAEIDRNITEPTLIDENIIFSTTCIGNFIQPDICTQYLKKMNGPVVYGEIAYQLLNQTTIYVTIGDTLKTELK
ncbi:MAG: hypothetical protein LBS09_10115 [Bacteroidales bacterium]|jgi:hypothetical protein|nr:hypothetical protein [Bacteroidales bacterium]